MQTFNSNRAYSASVGGSMKVYTREVYPLQGTQVALADLPPVGNVLPAGTPILVDDSDNKITTVHYAFVAMDVDTVTVQLKKGGEGTRVKEGMFLMEAPATYAGTGTADTVLAVDSSNEMYDEITLSAAITGLVNGETLVEANQTGAGAVIKVLPSALSVADVYVDAMAFDFGITGTFLSHGEVLQRRIPPIAPAVKTYLRENEVYLRFSNSK